MKNKYATEEQKEVKKFICLLLGLILIIVGVYFFTRAFVTKDLKDSGTESTYTEGVINSDIVIAGTMLNRSEKEYYVVAFSSEDTNLSYYNTIITNYVGEEESLKVYHLDTNNALNQKYVATDEDASTKFTNLEELKLGKFTLLKIKDGKVTKFITDIEKAKKELSVEK